MAKNKYFYAIKSAPFGDYFKGFDEIKGYSIWTYNEANAMKFDDENEVGAYMSQINIGTEMVKIKEK